MPDDGAKREPRCRARRSDLGKASHDHQRASAGCNWIRAQMTHMRQQKRWSIRRLWRRRRDLNSADWCPPRTDSISLVRDSAESRGTWSAQLTRSQAPSRTDPSHSWAPGGHEGSRRLHATPQPRQTLTSTPRRAVSPALVARSRWERGVVRVVSQGTASPTAPSPARSRGGTRQSVSGPRQKGHSASSQPQASRGSAMLRGRGRGGDGLR